MYVGEVGGVLHSGSCLYPIAERLEPSVTALWVGRLLGRGGTVRFFEAGISGSDVLG